MPQRIDVDSFKRYLFEQQRSILGSLNIFDIDDTLFHTTALITVVKDGKVVRELTNQEYNTYSLQPGETFGYHQFRDAEKFRRESSPIGRMITKANIIVNRQRSPLSKTIIITARADFDDKQVFLQTFRDHGFPIDNVYVERAGNMQTDALPAVRKAIIIKKYLDSNNFAKVRLFDDSMSNLKEFLKLEAEYPHVKFEAYFAKPDGGIKTIKEQLEEAKVSTDEKPLTQVSSAQLPSLLGKGAFNSMIKHPWMKDWTSYEQAWKHGVTRAGFHTVELYPYMRSVHTVNGAIRPEYKIVFTISHFGTSGRVVQAEKWQRSKVPSDVEKSHGPSAAWKHVKDWKSRDE